jgi:hypothetical protein
MSPDLENLQRGLETDTPSEIFAAPQDIVNNGRVVIPKGTMFAVFGDIVRYKIGERLKELRADSTTWKKLTDSGRLQRQRLAEDAEDDFTDIDWDEQMNHRAIRPARSKMVWVLGGSAAAILVAVASIMALGGGNDEVRAAEGERNVPVAAASAAPVVAEAVEVEKVTERWFRYYESAYGGNIYIYLEPTQNGGTHYKMYGSKNCKEFIWDKIAECDFNDPEAFPATKDEKGNEKARYFAKRALAYIKSDTLAFIDKILQSTMVQREFEEVTIPGSDIVWNNTEDEAITHQTQQETNKALPRKVTAWVTVPGNTTRLQVSAYRETGGINGTTTLFVQGTIYNVSSRPIQISRREHQKFYKVLSELELRDAAKLALQEVYQQNDEPAPAEYKIDVEMEEGW